ncbi:MAG: hypothetical protein HY934_06500 [Candidatus Firestonebacteria bacterium]|nr:hypothetical protein [Candidatus Firestonebacteria bacterium]
MDDKERASRNEILYHVLAAIKDMGMRPDIILRHTINTMFEDIEDVKKEITGDINTSNLDEAIKQLEHAEEEHKLIQKGIVEHATENNLHFHIYGCSYLSISLQAEKHGSCDGCPICILSIGTVGALCALIGRKHRSIKKSHKPGTDLCEIEVELL